jgi:fatty acid desaturase
MNDPRTKGEVRVNVDDMRRLLSLSAPDEEARRKKQVSIVALVLIVSGGLLLSATATALSGTIWAGCGIIGLIALTVGFLIGKNG